MWNIGDPLEDELLVAAFLRDNFPIAIGGKRGTVVQGCNYPARKKKTSTTFKKQLVGRNDICSDSRPKNPICTG